MTLRASVVTIVFCVTGVLLAPGTVQAITLPDGGTCGNLTSCLQIQNTGPGTSFRGISELGPAIQAISHAGTIDGDGVRADGYVGVRATGSNAGVFGISTSGYGLRGSSQTSYGIYGYSSSANGVVAQNNDINFSAATVSALSGDPQNGLAYWGTGAIQITSSRAEKAGGGSWQVYSDARLKRDISPLRLGLAQLRDVRPVTFKYNGLGGTTDDGHEFVGVIAQELEKVFPSMVTSRKGKLQPTDAADTDIKIVDPSALTFVLINSVKEQQAIIERQERRIAALERGRGITASMFGGNGVELGLAMGLLPLGFVALRRRKASKSAE